MRGVQRRNQCRQIFSSNCSVVSSFCPGQDCPAFWTFCPRQDCPVSSICPGQVCPAFRPGQDCPAFCPGQTVWYSVLCDFYKTVRNFGPGRTVRNSGTFWPGQDCLVFCTFWPKQDYLVFCTFVCGILPPEDCPVIFPGMTVRLVIFRITSE